ncbi:MAG: PAS domain S-box protein, partial [Pseudorhodobacter sp.]|nr:PAS domain S-box protein [Rhizobacter sp.]
LTSRSIENLHLETQHALIATKLSLEARAGELNASLALLRATLESSPDCIVATDTANRVLAWNQRYIASWNIPPLMMERRDGAELTDWVAAQLAEPVAFMTRLDAQQRLPELEQHDTFKLRDGRSFERFVAPQRIDGQCVGTVVCWRDVTERQRAQEALQQSQQRLQSVFDNALNAIVLIDQKGHLAEANLAACELLGYSRDELLGAAAEHFVVLPAAGSDGAERAANAEGADSADITADITADAARGYALRAHSRQHGRLNLRRKDGSVLLVEYKAEANVIEGLHLCVMSDFSARHQAAQLRIDKEVAEAASRSKSAFLSRMSHELRTPLNAMLGFSEVLRGGLAQGLTAEQDFYVEHIHRSGAHLLTLIEEVLDMSRIEADSMAILLQDLDAWEAAQDAVRSVNVLASSAEVEMVLQGTHSDAHGANVSTLRVRADPTRLHQVLLNLLSNAVKYNQPGGQVRLQVEAIANRVRFVVRDTGLGMSGAQIQGLFQPFNRLGRESSAVGGTGIGLVITRRLVELMGGTLQVNSEPGKGSEFAFDLEAAAAKASAPDKLPAEGTPPA